MSTHINDPFGDSSPDHDPHDPHDLPPVDTDTARIETEFFVLEPTLRDANRSLRDLLGTCPLSTDGNWVWVDHDGRVVLHGGIDGVRGLAETCRRLGIGDAGARSQLRSPSVDEGTYWVGRTRSYECDNPTSPHLPTGARLRHRDSREG